MCEWFEGSRNTFVFEVKVDEVHLPPMTMIPIYPQHLVCQGCCVAVKLKSQSPQLVASIILVVVGDVNPLILMTS